MFSTCEPFGVLNGDVYIYICAGIHAASQEVFSRTPGVMNKPYYLMLLCVVDENPKPLHVTLVYSCFVDKLLKI